MLQFTPAYFFSDKPNLAKKNCLCEQALIVGDHSEVSCVLRKPVFCDSNQVRHKSACAATEANSVLEIY